MTRIACGLLLVLLLLPCSGCITWSGGTDREEAEYPEFLREGKGSAVGVAAFSDETGLTRNRWGRRKVFMAVSGSLFGIVPWPWDLRLVWSPSAIEEDWTCKKIQFDETLSASIAARLEKHGFKGVVVDPRKSDGVETDLAGLRKAASGAGCKALYLVSYNEFTRLKYRTELRTHQGYLYHRLKILEGSALIPSTALFLLPAGGRILARANTAQKGNVYVDYFWAPFFTFGRWTPMDQASRAVERFIKEVSGKEIREARERCADFLAERDFTAQPEVPGTGTPGGKPPAEKPPEKPPAEKPPGEKPPSEKPPGKQPPGEKPPGDKPPAEKPPGEHPPEEKPPAETPPGETPPGEQPPGEKPPGEGQPGGGGEEKK